jgi:hypothetical protein
MATPEQKDLVQKTLMDMLREQGFPKGAGGRPPPTGKMSMDQEIDALDFLKLDGEPKNQSSGVFRHQADDTPAMTLQMGEPISTPVAPAAPAAPTPTIHDIPPEVAASIDKKIQEGADPSSLTNAEKIALGTLALAPILGGLIGGEKGALAGAAASSKGVQTFANINLSQEAAANKAALKSGTPLAKLNKRAGELVQGLEKRKAFQSFAETENAARKLIAFSRSDNPITDVAAIQTLLKVLDPRSVAREAEVAGVKMAASAEQALTNLWQGLKGASAIGPEQKKAMREIARTIMQVQANILNKDIDTVRRGAENEGIPGDLIIKKGQGNIVLQEISDAIDEANEGALGKQPKAVPKSKPKPIVSIDDAASVVRDVREGPSTLPPGGDVEVDDYWGTFKVEDGIMIKK